MELAEFTEYTPGTPCWIDLQTSDVDKGAEFYRTLFGWDRQDLGPEAGGYGFFLKDGKMVAGVGPKMDPQTPTAWSMYVCVSDAEATASTVKANGGTVILEPMDVMTAGRMAFFIDPTGAVLGVWQPRDHTGAQLANEVGSWGWSECQTRDVDKASSFYASVFGWKATPFTDMGNYVVFENEGRGIGGCMAMPDEVPKEVPAYWLNYFGVDDTDAAVDTAKAAGGGVFVPPMDIPSVGRFAVVSDPQGAVFAVIKTAPQAES
jgi:predicted enzyme related to lactoylglutathione lyase